MKSKWSKMAAVSFSMVFLAACSEEHVENGSQKESALVMTSEDMKEAMQGLVTYQEADVYSEWKDENPTFIELNGNEANFGESQSILANEGKLTIKTSGVYVLSGTWDNGQIVVDAEDEGTVRLILNGIDIKSETSAPIFIQNAGNTIISLADGTLNTLTDAKEYVLDESSEGEPNAALFSKDNLTINGTGSLRVVGNWNDGIKSKDDLKITGGTIEVEAVDDGIVGRDVVGVKDGSITIKAGGDGIKSTNVEKEGKGGIAIEGGQFTITSDNDGVQAATSLYVLDGSFLIKAGGGSPETIQASEQRPDPWGITENEDEDTDTPSTKGLKAATQLAICGGTFTIDSLDDALHSNDSVTIMDGSFDIETGDDGIHADFSVVAAGGTVAIRKSYEGIEGNRITIIDGEIHIVSSDDGINVGGGNDSSGFGMPGAGGMIHGQTGDQMPERPEDMPPAGDPPGNTGEMPAAGDSSSKPGEQKKTTTAGQSVPVSDSQKQADDPTDKKSEDDENKELVIQGGYISIDTDGDGLDSNGSIQMTGGTVIVNGPTDNGNGSLDYDETFELIGGTLLTAGSSGMAMAPSKSSTQNSIVMTFPDVQAAGTMIHLADSQGNSIATFAPKVEFTSVLISTEKLKKGETYTLYSGGSATGTDQDGFYSETNYQGGTKVVSFEISESATWLNETGVTTGGNGGPGGGSVPGGMDRPQGQRPDDMFEGLDDETKQEVQQIMKQMREDTLSWEEADKKLKGLGITQPKRDDGK
ncbi:carbohydrate-binding domain-containing protein [Sporosarcina sp. Te-1]|uniref:carbohydrate-binding domain-containing protein n=1 Tax=Sporosarcina sp. Te-1 TaxID=2818390 RepID=UPI001A9EA9D0|nr:carbohydrate-binding domain-containing protein [Sporosarcina sp. Te-1]QTD41885.1 carbohydrate-binding domain-containing protein [Sporosarcina sp. Te-1]